ncbi:hypothetical protein HF264_28885 [Rhizobium leguminosarum]|uniref:hypothetical protein n=1 Tax=Rhizobium leguminosarum TaxID=384 RepID=UPI001C90B352|nr:hypothetical protein [Rhizobium leguminosarum]MBY2943672.1 hypothetical protein [Rhizobium leguminosarum]
MELRQLSYFVAVAEGLHVIGKCRLGDAHLGGRPAEVQFPLERELGCALFIRSTRRVELTRPFAP